MSQEDWVKKYAKMDKRMLLKYAQLPDGEQIGKQRPIIKHEPKNK